MIRTGGSITLTFALDLTGPIAKRGLTVREFVDERFDFGTQIWLIVE